jgi:hypothetical protein
LVLDFLAYTETEISRLEQHIVTNLNHSTHDFFVVFIKTSIIAVENWYKQWVGHDFLLEMSNNF